MRLQVAFKSAERLRERMLALTRRYRMSRKKPVTPDPGEASDWGSHAQTKEPWKGNPEKWQESDTH
jgi:hypothetical protein